MSTGSKKNCHCGDPAHNLQWVLADIVGERCNAKIRAGAAKRGINSFFSIPTCMKNLYKNVSLTYTHTMSEEVMAHHITYFIFIIFL